VIADILGNGNPDQRDAALRIQRALNGEPEWLH
jgi:hypothetical protein